MAILGFAGKASADAWIEDCEILNNETDILLKNISMCLEDIGQDGKGSLLDTLVATGTEMLNTTAVMVTSFKKMRDLVQDLALKIIEAIAGNDSLLGTVANVIGRLGN